jgi:hypothetical protein
MSSRTGPRGDVVRDPDRLSHGAAELIDGVHLARPLADGRGEADMVDADLQAVGLDVDSGVEPTT